MPSVKQVLVVQKIAKVLGVDPSYFIDRNTGFLKENFKKIVELRCSEIGIYSITELGQRLGSDRTWQELDRYDRQAKKSHRDLKALSGESDPERY